MMTSAHGNFIGGTFVSSPATPNLNPSNLTDAVGEYAQDDKAQVAEAIAMARAAFPSWSKSMPRVRSEVLDRAGEFILAGRPDLGRLPAREECKIPLEAVGEVAGAGQIFKFFAGEALRLAGEVLVSVRPRVEVDITHEPVGVVGLIAPWNFLITIPAWKLEPALAFGNCAASKPANLTPGCGHALVSILHDAGVPAGVVNLITGRGSVVGNALDAETQIGPVVDEKQLQQNLDYITIARDEGAEVVGGVRLELTTQSFFLQPAPLPGADQSMRVDRGELLGPMASVIRVSDGNEAIAVANDAEFGLSAGVCTTSLARSRRFKRDLEAGMIMVNLPTAGVDYHVPFGGRKSSSIGRASRAATPANSRWSSRPVTLADRPA